jgi:hypothetical protein
MSLDTAAVLKQIDEVIAYRNQKGSGSKYDDMSDLGDAVLTELVSLIEHTITRFAPPGSSFTQQVARISQSYGATHPHYAHQATPWVPIGRQRRTQRHPRPNPAGRPSDENRAAVTILENAAGVSEMEELVGQLTGLVDELKGRAGRRSGPMSP